MADGRDVEGRTVNTRILTPEELANRWSVPKSHVYRLTREQRIPVVKLGRYYRYRLDEIERFELGDDVDRRKIRATT